MRAKIDDALIEHARLLRAEGKTWPVVGHTLKVNGEHLAAEFRERGIKTGKVAPPNRVFSEKLLSDAHALLASGKTVIEAYKALGGRKKFSLTGFRAALKKTPVGAAPAAAAPSTAIVLATEKPLRVRKQTASDFIRSLPKDLSNDEATKLVLEAGFKCGPTLVSTVRSQERSKAAGTVRKKKPAYDESLINDALVRSASAHVNTDRLVKRAAREVFRLISKTRITKLELDLRTKKYVCTFETQEEGSL